MADSIETGAFLEYQLDIQVMPDDGSDSFEGIDLLDHRIERQRSPAAG